MDKLIDYVCEELEQIEKKAAKSGNLTAAEVEYADKLAHLKKNLLKGEMMYEEMGYSGEAGGSYARGGQGGGNRGGNRGGGSSRAYRGGSYEGGSYAGGSYARGNGRGRGSNANRDSMGRYSSEYGYSGDADELVEKLEDLMEEAPNEQMRREIEKLARKVRSM